MFEQCMVIYIYGFDQETKLYKYIINILISRLIRYSSRLMINLTKYKVIKSTDTRTSRLIINLYKKYTI